MVVAEESLTKDAVSGDGDALNRLLCRYDPALRARIGPKIDRKHRAVLDVDDVLQVTYMEAFLRISGFRHNGPGSFLAWLSKIAEHNLVDALRGLGAEKRPSPDRRIQPGSDESYARLLSSLSESGTTPSGHASRNEWRSMIEDALSKLPVDYEKVIRLYYFEGLSAAEIGERLGRTAPAIHMLKGRAFARLGELISETQFFGNLS